MEEVVEEAISNCAADCLEGLRIWAVILEWSKTTQNSTKTEQYFKQMLSFPYISLQTAYEQYTQWHDSINIPVRTYKIQIVDIIPMLFISRLIPMLLPSTRKLWRSMNYVMC